MKNAAFGPFGDLDVQGLPHMAEDDLADVVATGEPQEGTADAPGCECRLRCVDLKFISIQLKC